MGLEQGSMTEWALLADTATTEKCTATGARKWSAQGGGCWLAGWVCFSVYEPWQQRDSTCSGSVGGSVLCFRQFWGWDLPCYWGEVLPVGGTCHKLDSVRSVPCSNSKIFSQYSSEKILFSWHTVLLWAAQLIPIDSISQYELVQYQNQRDRNIC